MVPTRVSARSESPRHHGNGGIVQELSVASGDPLLAAALETVRHWVYEPVKLNGRPIEVATQIEVDFA